MRTNIAVFLTVLSISILAFPVSAMATPTPTPNQQTSTQTHSSSAPNSITDPGSNLADWLKSWVGAMFGIIVGAVGLGAVAKRSVGEGLALLLVALIVGGFVIAPNSMNALTQAVWTKIAG